MSFSNVSLSLIVKTFEVLLEQGVEGEEEGDPVEHWAPILGTVEEVGLHGSDADIKQLKNNLGEDYMLSHYPRNWWQTFG